MLKKCLSVSVVQLDKKDRDWETIIDTIYDTEVKQAQTDKLKADVTTQQEQAALIGVNRKLAELDLMQKGELYDTNVDYRKQEHRKLKSEIDVLLNRDQREALMNSTNVKKGLADVARIYQGMETEKMERKKWEPLIKSMWHDERVKRLDAYFAAKNIRPQDPLYAHVAVMLLEQMVKEFNAKSSDKIMPKIKEGLKSDPLNTATGAGLGVFGHALKWFMD